MQSAGDACHAKVAQSGRLNRGSSFGLKLVEESLRHVKHVSLTQFGKLSVEHAGTIAAGFCFRRHLQIKATAVQHICSSC